MGRRWIWIALPAAMFLAICTVDLLRETDPWDPVEVTLDIAQTLMLVVMMVTVAWSFQRMSRMDEDQQALKDHLVRQDAAGEAWRAARAKEIAAMGDAITREFQRWGLTEAEVDVAGLLLKGASMKEIALARKTSEATIRQQAQSMYRKAGLSGRVELSAYFLDSLLDATDANAVPPLAVVAPR